MHGELFPGLRNENENRPNNVTVFCCYFFSHEQNVQHYFSPLGAILQERNTLIGMLASAVCTPAARSKLCEGAFPGTWRATCWRVVGCGHIQVLIRLGRKRAACRWTSFLWLLFLGAWECVLPESCQRRGLARGLWEGRVRVSEARHSSSQMLSTE